MRSLTVWACTCGVRYKAICELTANSKVECTIVCPKCQKQMTVDGMLIDCVEDRFDLLTWPVARKTIEVQLPKTDA